MEQKRIISWNWNAFVCRAICYHYNYFINVLNMIFLPLRILRNETKSKFEKKNRKYYNSSPTERNRGLREYNIVYAELIFK